MGESRRLGDREPPSTQATSSSVRSVSRARSAARWPAASSARSRRVRDAPGPSSASLSDRRRASVRPLTRPAARASTWASAGSPVGGAGPTAASTDLLVRDAQPGERTEDPLEEVTEIGYRIRGVDRARRSRIEERSGRGGQRSEPARPDLHTETVGHHLLDLMGLVEDDHLVWEGARHRRWPDGRRRDGC